MTKKIISSDTYIDRLDITDEPTIYQIEYNMYKPLLVIVTKNEITVNKGQYITKKKAKTLGIDKFDEDEPCYLEKIFEITEFEGLWIGYEPENNKLTGKDLLVKINDKKYLHITNTIEKIILPEPIIDFIVNYQNSAVPYEYAVMENYIYNFCDNTLYPINQFDFTIKPSNYDKIHDLFYHHGLNYSDNVHSVKKLIDEVYL